MWSHTFETTWLRGNGALPVICARSAEGVTGRASPPPALRAPCAIMALLLFLTQDRAQSSHHCNGVAERKSAIFPRERNDLVAGVVADVGGSSETDARTIAPVFDDRGL